MFAHAEELHIGIEPWVAIPLKPENDHEGQGIAYVLGDLDELAQDPNGVLIRMHSECVFGEVFGSLECECGPQRDAAIEAIRAEGGGIFFYLFQEGRGAGLEAKLIGYMLHQQLGVDSGEAYTLQNIPIDQREYGHCVRFMEDHGIKIARVMSNNPDKFAPIEQSGIICVRQPLIPRVSEAHKRQMASYMQWKISQGHLLLDDPQ